MEKPEGLFGFRTKKMDDKFQVRADEFRHKVNIVLDNEEDRSGLFKALRSFQQTRKINKLVRDLKVVLNSEKKYPLFKEIRSLIPNQHLLVYDKLVELDRNNERLVRIMKVKDEPLGFSFRGGFEHGVGFYVTTIVPGSAAEVGGLEIGDEIRKINGLPLHEAIHNELLAILKNKTQMLFLVKNAFRIPSKVNNRIIWHEVHDPLNDEVVTDMKVNGVNGNAVNDSRMFSFQLGNEKLGCSIKSGIKKYPGIYIAAVGKDSLAERVGLKVGNQILDINGKSFINISHENAVLFLKDKQDFTMVVKHNKMVEEIVKKSDEKSIKQVRFRNGDDDIWNYDASEDEDDDQKANDGMKPAELNFHFPTSMLKGREVHFISIPKGKDMLISCEYSDGVAIVKSIPHNSAIARHGFIREGDWLLNVEGDDLIHRTAEEANVCIEEAIMYWSKYLDVIVACPSGRLPPRLPKRGTSIELATDNIFNVPSEFVVEQKEAVGAVRGAVKTFEYEHEIVQKTRRLLRRTGSLEKMKSKQLVSTGKQTNLHSPNVSKFRSSSFDGVSLVVNPPLNHQIIVTPPSESKLQEHKSIMSPLPKTKSILLPTSAMKNDLSPPATKAKNITISSFTPVTKPIISSLSPVTKPKSILSPKSQKTDIPKPAKPPVIRPKPILPSPMKRASSPNLKKEAVISSPIYPTTNPTKMSAGSNHVGQFQDVFDNIKEASPKVMSENVTNGSTAVKSFDVEQWTVEPMYTSNKDATTKSMEEPKISLKSETIKSKTTENMFPRKVDKHIKLFSPDMFFVPDLNKKSPAETRELPFRAETRESPFRDSEKNKKKTAKDKTRRFSFEFQERTTSHSDISPTNRSSSADDLLNRGRLGGLVTSYETASKPLLFESQKAKQVKTVFDENVTSTNSGKINFFPKNVISKDIIRVVENVMPSSVEKTFTVQELIKMTNKKNAEDISKKSVDSNLENLKKQTTTSESVTARQITPLEPLSHEEVLNISKNGVQLDDLVSSFDKEEKYISSRVNTTQVAFNVTPRQVTPTTMNQTNLVAEPYNANNDTKLKSILTKGKRSSPKKVQFSNFISVSDMGDSSTQANGFPEIPVRSYGNRDTKTKDILPTKSLRTSMDIPAYDYRINDDTVTPSTTPVFDQLETPVFDQLDEMMNEDHSVSSKAQKFGGKGFFKKALGKKPPSPSNFSFAPNHYSGGERLSLTSHFQQPATAFSAINQHPNKLQGHVDMLSTESSLGRMSSSFSRSDINNDKYVVDGSNRFQRTQIDIYPKIIDINPKA